MFNQKYCSFQHASGDVEKMILGNKKDMEEKRVVAEEKGQMVKLFTMHLKKFYQFISFKINAYYLDM